MMSLSPVSRKEARELAPYFLGAVVTLVLIAITLQQNAGGGTITLRVLCIGIFYVAACLVAVWPISSEFGHNTMARLLAQPVPRAQIWRQKFGWSALAIGGQLLLALVGIAILPGLGFTMPDGKANPVGLLVAMHAVMLLTSGAFMAVYLRQTLTALMATMIVPFLYLILAALLGEVIESSFHVDLFQPKYEVVHNISIAYVLPQVTWTILAYILARRRFLNLEV